MSANRLRSKKRSVASSKQPPETRALYLDRNLGKHVIANALRKKGFAVEVHDDHLPINVPDEDWIKLVGQRGWVALTKDKNIRHRYAKFDAIFQHKASVIVIRAKSITGNELSKLVVQHFNSIQQFAAGHSAPFVAGIDRSGNLSLYK